MKQQRFDALTGLRAIAAAMVFIFHNKGAWVGWLPDWVIRYFDEFLVGVSVFFVLSGFVIAYTYSDKPLSGKKEYVKYFLIRLARIYPMYLIILTMELMYSGIPSGKELLIAYTLTQGYFADYNLSWLTQAWTLTVEINFYILAPFFFRQLLKSIPKTFALMLLLMCLAIGTGYLLNYIHWNRIGFLPYPMFVLNGSFFGRFVEFGLGIFLAQVITGRRKAAWLMDLKQATLAGGCLTVASITLIALFQKELISSGIQTLAGALIRNTIFAFSVMIFLKGLITERTWVSRFLSSEIMVVMGNASFIFYLIHVKVVNNVLLSWHFFPDRNFTLLWLVAIAAYYLVEKPLYNLMKRGVNRIF